MIGHIEISRVNARFIFRVGPVKIDRCAVDRGPACKHRRDIYVNPAPGGGRA